MACLSMTYSGTRPWHTHFLVESGKQDLAGTIFAHKAGAQWVKNADCKSTFWHVLHRTYRNVSIHDLALQPSDDKGSPVRSVSGSETPDSLSGNLSEDELNVKSHCWSYIQQTCDSRACQYFHPQDIQPCMVLYRCNWHYKLIFQTRHQIYSMSSLAWLRG